MIGKFKGQIGLMKMNKIEWILAQCWTPSDIKWVKFKMSGFRMNRALCMDSVQTGLSLDAYDVLMG